MRKLQVLDQSPDTRVRWTIARGMAMAATLLLLVALWIRPGPALLALWYIIIPVLPATFFVTPALWRGLCPLASLNEWGNRVRPAPEIPPATLGLLRATGLVLFLLLVPARHFLFNEHGRFLALVILAVGGAALFLGVVYPVRSAWCNGLCPVLPVELLYGQAPLQPTERSRCPTCTVCTPRGCIDLAGEKTILQVVGPGRRSRAWLATPHGAFFAALPGFIVGYNVVGDGALASAPAVYGTIFEWSLGSLALAGLVVGLFGVPSRRILPLLAALAGVAYYWFAGPAIALHLGLGRPVSLMIQLAGIALVLWWARKQPGLRPQAPHL